MNSENYFEGIRQYKLLAKREVGQNFLANPVLASKVVDLLGGDTSGKVLEIGSGAGSLTYFLIERGFRGKAIDIDEGLVAKLSNDFPHNDSIEIVRSNALEEDMSGYAYIIGNLPYYITSAILERCLLETKSASKAVFMVQKEAYERITAKPGSKDYSPLGIVFGLVGKAKKEFSVSPSNFVPAPHVDSLVFSYSYSQGRDLEFYSEFYDFLKAAFSLRRKTIANSLSRKYGGKALGDALKDLCLEKARAESLDVQTLLRLFLRLRKN